MENNTYKIILVRNKKEAVFTASFLLTQVCHGI